MSSTNHTTNYNLPQFVGSDKPAWLGDINPAMSAIDTAIHNASTTASQGVSDASTAKNRADSAYTKAGDAELAAGTAQETANQAVSGLTTANNRIDGLYGKLNLTDITSANITLYNGQNFWLNLAQSSDGSIFKVYGHLYIDNNSNSGLQGAMDKTAIPGQTGVYGFATGLYLKTAPDESYGIFPCGYCVGGTRGYSKGSTDYMDAGNFFDCGIYVGTDAQIYISPFNTWSNSGRDTIGAYTRSRVFWLPMVYFNTNFGDEPTPNA